MLDLLDYLSSDSWLFWTAATILGLLVGGILNVIIQHLPGYLNEYWVRKYKKILKVVESEDKKKNTDKKGQKVVDESNLKLQSACQSCDARWSFWQYMPFSSFFFLKARCDCCETRIPFRFVWVEILSGALTMLAAVEFNLSMSLIFILIFIWVLIIISFIEIESGLLPDILISIILWTGLLASCFEFFSNCQDAILGAITGYLFLFVIDRIFYFASGRDGIDHGNIKLLAACGAWLGWGLLPFVVVTSSAMALIYTTFYFIFRKKNNSRHIPFSPFIAIAAIIGIIWGYDITQHYFNYFGFNWTNV